MVTWKGLIKIIPQLVSNHEDVQERKIKDKMNKIQNIPQFTHFPRELHFTLLLVKYVKLVHQAMVWPRIYHF